MGLREDIAQEISRQAEARGAPVEHKESAAEGPRPKFDRASSTPEALRDWDALTNREAGLYVQTEGGRSRLGSLPSSDAELAKLSWKPGPRPPEGASRLFARNGERWAEPVKSIG